MPRKSSGPEEESRPSTAVQSWIKPDPSDFLDILTFKSWWLFSFIDLSFSNPVPHIDKSRPRLHKQMFLPEPYLILLSIIDHGFEKYRHEMPG